MGLSIIPKYVIHLFELPTPSSLKMIITLESNFEKYKIDLDQKRMELIRGAQKMTKEQKNELQKLGIIQDN